ncbi:hypothetical protein FRX31_017033 [Thalictrum thalictroides]|uniref:Uncharacterized protein n=1 Tax=Thalictrum thalictroides TaxID=46969 RepID=A0A7J6W9W2_THATH|nr:hypothetical protein FRX31_017033 [Thalictrum thalictroides]
MAVGVALEKSYIKVSGHWGFVVTLWSILTRSPICKGIPRLEMVSGYYRIEVLFAKGFRCVPVKKS